LVDNDPDPGLYEAITVNVASPNVANYKAFSKYEKKLTLYMDVWSKEEIGTIAKFHATISSETMENRFSLLGGVPRLIFSPEDIEVFELINNNKRPVDTKLIQSHSITQSY
jgi:hypothetical protein